jgi:hypothetical protein
LLGYLFVFAGCCWTKPAAVFKDVFSISKECWVAVKVNFTVLGLIPFSVEKEILCVKQLFDLASVVFWSIRNRKGVIIRD